MICLINVYSSAISNLRHPWQAQRGVLRLLPRALPGHHVRDQDQAQDALLLLQPHRALRAHRVHGGAGIHPAARLGREAVAR